ncbi:MAG: hypothetical protein ACRYGP_06090 [Janthinobacterium lividum]
MGEKAEVKSTARPRKDGRRQLLVYLPPDLIKALKKAALDEEITVYEIVEGASQEWLRRRERKQLRGGSRTLRPVAET